MKKIKLTKRNQIKPPLEIFIESEKDEEIKRRRKETGKIGGLKRGLQRRK